MPARSHRPSALAMGANLGDAVGAMLRARAQLTGLLDGVGARKVRFSRLFQTLPVGPVQPRYFNACCAFDLPSDVTAPFLLEKLQRLEHRAGRTRAIHWGPRTLDLDLLVVGAIIRADSWLTLPHPRMAERAFVLVPLLDVAPQLHIPRAGTVARLAARVDRSGVWPVTSDGADWRAASV